jgi:SAM-dependent methyltransferase
MPGEADRIRDVFRDYEQAGRSRRWDPCMPGNRESLRQRTEEAASIIDRAFPKPRVLDIGCGTGGVIHDLSQRIAGGRWFGVDLIGDRVAEASAAVPSASFAVADGAALPFASGTFDLVCAFTVFSSILDDEIAQGVASEIARCLRSGGGVLIYDFRYPSRNPNTRSFGRRHVTRLFDWPVAAARSLTVLPPLARRLGAASSRLYPLLARVPPLRSHALVLLTKP